MSAFLQLLQIDDWTIQFDSATLKRGLDYAAQGRAHLLHLSGLVLLAECQGSGRKMYKQSIRLESNFGDIDGDCSCPVGYNCKHVVAALAHLLQNSAPASPGTASETRLSHGAQEWLQQLPAARQQSDTGYPPGELSRLYYQLLPGGEVVLHKARLRKDGSPTDLAPYYALREAIIRQPRFLLPLDLRIARLAYSCQDRGRAYDNVLQLAGSAGGELLALLLESQRLFIDPHAPESLLRSGPPRHGHFLWRQEDDCYCPAWQVEGLEAGGAVIGEIEPLYYIDLHSHQAGLLQHDLPPSLASHLHQAPAIDSAEAALFSLALQELVPQAPLPTPAQEQRIDDLLPTAHLSLGSHNHSYYDARTGRMTHAQQHRAGLSFDYAGLQAHGKQIREPRIRRAGNGEIVSIARQAEAEQALRKQLQQLGLRASLRQSQALPEDSAEMFELPNDAAWLNFTQQQLPALREQGWRIDIQPSFAFDITPLDDWYAELDEAPEHDWFELELGIQVDGQRISLLPVLMQLIRRNPELLSADKLASHGDDEQLRLQLDATRSSDGRPLQVLLPFGRLKPLLATLGELYLRDQPLDAKLRLGIPDAARLADLDALIPNWQGGERLREFAHRLRDSAPCTVEAPPGLNAELRPYQLEGLNWMQTLRELQAGGVLADDMGLGKTLQSLAHLLVEKHAGRLDRPALAVMPTSLIPNWQDEAARFAPELRVLVLHGPHRHQDFARLADYDLLLTTYALLPRDLEQLRQQPLHVLILDEAQNIKNPTSKAAQAARQLDARQRLCLTGTPLENHLGELWSLFNCLMPGWLGDSKRFNRDYRTPIEKHGDLARLAHLKARIRPFLLRRKKDQVATELPAKSEIVHWIELGEAQRDLYETVRLAMDRKVREEIQRKGLASSQIVILEALLKLRQVCCDLRLVKSANNPAKLRGGNSAKLDSLMEMLTELFEEGRRVLLFSQFTSMLTLIEQELQRRELPYVLLTGSTEDRRTPVQRFQNGEVPLFLISLKAGGTGLNLTAADTVIHFDPWWNPAAENQATDRAYRIGQDKPVFVYKLIARGTVEEKIQQLQERKRALAAGVLEGGQHGKWQLQPEDITALFAPLPHVNKHAD